MLKSSDRIEIKPTDMTETLYLEVDYMFGISMGYHIFFNPLTGEACIEKGLVSNKYFSIDTGFIDSINTDKCTITDSGSFQTAQLDKNEYLEFRDNLIKTDEWPENNNPNHTYYLNAFLPNGTIWEYIILADFESNQYYVKTHHGTFISSGENMTSILSSDPVFSDLTEEIYPIPELVLTSGYNLLPHSRSVEWEKIRPDGQSSTIKYTDSYPSTIGMPEPGTLLSITYDDGNPIGDNVILTLSEYRNGSLFTTYDMHVDEITIPYFEGLLGYSLEAAFQEGTQVYDYEIMMSIPAVAECPYTEARPGNTLAFFVRYADADEDFFIESNIGNFSSQLVPYGDVLLGLLPINWWTSPGTYSVDIFKEENEMKSLYAEYDITVLPDDFEVTYQQLVVSDELAKKADPVNTANDGVLIAKAKASSNETSYLDGTFILPLEGAFGTSYAQTRYINGENPYRHSGLDIDGDTGDPIVACNDGVVVMATELVRTGNTIIIDHGMWLFSSYLHMSAFDVEVGDFVKKGDLIGKVGSTGFSTGPHLHWSVTLNGNYMSPLWLVNNPVVPQ